MVAPYGGAAMPEYDEHDYLTFFDIFQGEASAINARRRAVAAERARKAVRCEVRERPTKPDNEGRSSMDERLHKVPHPRKGHYLTGLALSGGGIRSASFCLGVLQAIDAVSKEHEPQVLDQVDYLSTVSGGGYIGTSLVSGLMQSEGLFPFRSKVDQEETIQTQHVRDYSNFLAPEGIRDFLVGFVAISRGLLINAFIFLGVLLLVAGMTVYLNPNVEELNRSLMGLPLFRWTAIAVAVLMACQVGYALLASHRRARRLPLAKRERWSRVLAFAMVAVVLIGLIEAQAYLIAYLVDKNLLDWLSATLAAVSATLAPVALALGASAGKLAAVARTMTGDRTWKGSFKRWASWTALYIAAAVVPFLLWCTYILLCYWGIRANITHGDAGHPGIPDWLTGVAGMFPRWLVGTEGIFGPECAIALLYGLAGLALLGISILVKPNAGSLHGYYRDRLSRAFLWQQDILREVAQGNDAACDSPMDVDRFKFSSLKKWKDGLWDPDVRLAPYLLVNTAVNLEGSKYLNRRGRNADSFLFSPLFIGSEATGYAYTLDMEQMDRNINLGTAMAASGAAASANMGDRTIRPLTFSLAALNVRLGYWAPNPRHVHKRGRKSPFIAGVGLAYYALETFGLLNEETQNVYLTDGGHFDNLGIYELLKRRCALIIAVDAEADPGMYFESFIRVQRYARIDLGTLIDLPWESLRRSALSVCDEKWRRPVRPEAHRGPHAALGIIHYGNDEKGVLIYIKSSMSGDENDLICDFKRRHVTFPHQTTADQFFSEEQFEVYRALGFHAARGLLSGDDAFAKFPVSRYPGWLELLGRVLKHIEIPRPERERILVRANDGKALTAEEKAAYLDPILEPAAEAGE